jgi:hypothetical protein
MLRYFQLSKDLHVVESRGGSVQMCRAVRSTQSEVVDKKRKVDIKW